jgi:hypothetical protein
MNMIALLTSRAEKALGEDLQGLKLLVCDHRQTTLFFGYGTPPNSCEGIFA